MPDASPRPSLADLRAHAPADVPVVHTRDDDALWFYGTTIVTPGLVLLCGLLFVRSRRRRRTS